MITIVTHSGSFHPDDVFAVATLQLVLRDQDVHIVRSRDESVISTCEWIVDVGGVYDPEVQRFDHHQPGAPVRENGIPYAAFGLIWQHVGTKLCGSVEVAAKLEEQLVQPIDAGDNGINLYTINEYKVKPYELYQVVHLFAPPWGTGGSKDEAFLKAVGWAQGLLEQAINQQRAFVAMEEIVEHTYQTSSDKQILVFDVPVPAVAAVPYPEVMVVVCPDDTEASSNWTVTTVRKEYDSFEPRAKFPAAWAGLHDEALEAVSSIEGAGFCHKARFFFVAKSKSVALRAAKYVA